MIEPKDLRLNNWVHANTPNMRVKEIYEHSVGLYMPGSESDNLNYSVEQLQGIPITSLILGRCGFKYDKEEYRYTWQPEFENMQVRVQEVQATQWRISKGFYSWDDQLRNVKYLHELQNAVYFGLGYEINYTP